jgi:hypothetical protein
MNAKLDICDIQQILEAIWKRIDTAAEITLMICHHLHGAGYGISFANEVADMTMG